MPVRPGGRVAVQVAVESDARPPQALVATGAVAYRDTTLSSLMQRPDVQSLVGSDIRLYMGCARTPRVTAGVAQAPAVVVSHGDDVWFEHPTSPFHGVLDLYSLQDLGVADSKLAPDVTVLWVDRRIPGGALIPAVQAAGPRGTKNA
jgi:hypothetical protein